MERVKSKEIDFNYLVRRGIIEYLDAEEEENALVALSEQGNRRIRQPISR